MADDTNNILDTRRRFEIFVPKPKARMNFGAKNVDSTGPFGYDGISIQSDVHLFIDANKNTLFQTGTDYCGQVGGKWVQYSNSDMVMSATASVNLSASKKIVIATGAGQGQVTALDHGVTPSPIRYNELGLHYQVDKLQVGLFEFFFGRRKRDERGPKAKAALRIGGIDDEDTYFDGKGDASTCADATDLGKGFATVAATSLRELYPVAAKRGVDKFDEKIMEPGDPVELIDDLVNRSVFGSSDDVTDLEYGYSGYLGRFDPYGRIKAGATDGKLRRGVIGMLNVLKGLARFIDVTEKYASLLSDNFLMKRAQAAMSAYSGFLGTFTGIIGVGKLTFGSFDKPQFMGGLGGMFKDEYDSGLGARAAGAGAGAGAGDAATEARQKIDDKKASVTSGRGPWDLSAKTTAAELTMNLEWGDKSAPTTTTVALQNSETAAQLKVSPDADAVPRLLVAVDASNLPAGVAFSSIESALADALGVTSAELSGADTSPGATIQPEAEILRQILYARAELDLTELLAASAPLPAVTVADIGLSVTHSTSQLAVAINGTWGSVDIATSSLTASNKMDALLRTALDGLGSASATPLASGSFVLKTSELGTDASIEIGSADDWVLSALGHQSGTVVRGQGPLDLSSVTADQIVARIAASAGLVVSAADGMFTLTAPRDDGLDPVSYVKVTGGPTEDIFGSGTAEDEVTKLQTSDFAKGVASMDAGIAALKSWNHELGKLPEDLRNLTRPLRQATGKVASTISSLESAVENTVAVVGSPLLGLPSAPNAIGLIADAGITMGTKDRIVGVGGQGVVFICDGGSGDEDHQKFVGRRLGVEAFVNAAMKWDPIDALLKKKDVPPVPPKKGESDPALGFRVLSDSTVDLLGTRSAQLMALGRAKLAKAFPDDEKDDVGVGVVRIAGSHAAELAGYRKVVISARNKGKDDKTGGRVELAGQTIAIGAMNLSDTADTQDFGGTDKDGWGVGQPAFGLAPLDVDGFAGVEHLNDDQKTTLKDDFKKYAWPKTLRHGGAKGHPNTERVFMHAVQETVVQVGTYVVQVRSADTTEPGVQIGTRVPNPDPTINEIDPEKPFLILDDGLITLGHKDSGAGILLGDNSVVINDEQGGSAVELQGGEVTIKSKNDAGTVKVTASGIEVKKGSNTLKLTGGGIDAKGSKITWG